MSNSFAADTFKLKIYGVEYNFINWISYSLRLPQWLYLHFPPSHPKVQIQNVHVLFFIRSQWIGEFPSKNQRNENFLWTLTDSKLILKDPFSYVLFNLCFYFEFLLSCESRTFFCVLFFLNSFFFRFLLTIMSWCFWFKFFMEIFFGFKISKTHKITHFLIDFR